MAKAKKEKKVYTGASTRAAIREIQRKTKWPLKRLAEFMGMNYETLRKIAKGYTKTPNDWTMAEIDSALQQVRKGQ
jgi:hypothetical protein